MNDRIRNFFRRIQAVGMERNPGSKWNLENERRLEEFALGHWDSSLGPEHGPGHWRRVARFGEAFWMHMRVDPDVIQAFAYLHDIERRDNLVDIDHGLRACWLIDLIRDTVLWHLGPRQIHLLKKACRLHSGGGRTGIPTIDACFDADRLDLPRSGTAVDPRRLATHLGRDISVSKWYRDIMEEEGFHIEKQ